MTYKNAKTVFVAVLAIGLLGSSIVFSENAVAENNKNKGKNTISPDFPTFTNPDVKHVIEIMEKLNQEDISSIQQESLFDEHQKIIDKYEASKDSKKHNLALKNLDLITDALMSSIASVGVEKSMPISAMYVDDSNGELVIGIDPMNFSDETAESVLKDIRSIVGDEVDVKIQPFRTAYYTCSQWDDCEPAQAGVKIGPGFLASCSIGFKATYNGDEGFVTAGHCNGGSKSGTIGQPDYVWWDHIGTVTDNSLESGTYFDGMFVHVDDGETISDKVYNNINVNTAGYASYLDGVIAEGWKTQGVSGVVVASSAILQVQGDTLRDQALISAIIEPGDSGGPVYELTPTLGLVGIISASDFSTFTSISKQQNADYEMPGLAWDFN